MARTKRILFTILMIFAVSACSAQSTQTAATSAPTQVVAPAFTESLQNLPLTEGEVPRATVEEARTAFENGTAILVDVRTPGAFEASHIQGAISLPLGEIERDPAAVPLDKEQWIITYCT